MSKIKLTIVFNGDSKRAAKDGRGPIQIRAYRNRKKKLLTTGIRVQPSEWDGTQVIGHPSAFHYNAEIRRQLLELEQFVLDHARVHGDHPTLGQLSAFHTRGDEGVDFLEFYELNMRADLSIKESTKKKERTTLNHLKECFPAGLAFSELDVAAIVQFNNYLMVRGVSPNGAHSYHKKIKKYVGVAIARGHLSIDRNPYRSYKHRTTPTKTDFLQFSEVLQLEQATFEHPRELHLDMKRDLFLMCCYTGLRYGDASQIRYRDIEQDSEGLLLVLIAQKTGKSSNIPLYKLFGGKPQHIVKKWQQLIGGRPDDFIFHPYSNQRYNKDLRKIAERAGIRRYLTSHMGRHTFGTYMASKVPLPVLKDLMQHGDIKTTMKYVHLSRQGIDQALDDVQW